MKYIANPVEVEAFEIWRVWGANADGSRTLVLNDVPGLPHFGHQVVASAGMLARYTPLVGDYLVRQEDGYEYLNPKAVFERKYRILPKCATTS